MGVAVGIDVAKEFHWVCAVDQDRAQVLLSRRVGNSPPAIAGLVDELEGLAATRGPLTVGLDMMGGIAALLTAMLHEAGRHLVHVSGLAVNRAREGTSGGEHKSDPKDAAVIAELVRTKPGLRPIEAPCELDAEIRLLAGRRRELVGDQTRRLARLRDLLSSVHPGLERVSDPTQKASLVLFTRYVTPGEIRRAGTRRLIAHLERAGHLRRAQIQALAEQALTSAKAQQVAVPGERVAAGLVRELAGEALAVRERLLRLDAELVAALERHPDAALILSLPGMGVALTAEFIAEAGRIERFPTADQLAGAAGLAPVLRQSGKVRFLRRAGGGNKRLKRVFYQSAFCSLAHPASRPSTNASGARARPTTRR